MRAKPTVALVIVLAFAATAQAQRHEPRRPERGGTHAGAPPAAPSVPLLNVPAPGIGMLPPPGGFTQIVPFHDGEFPGTLFAAAREHTARLVGPPVASAYAPPTATARTKRFGTPGVVYGLPLYFGAYAVPQYFVPIAPTPQAQPVQERVVKQVTSGNLVLQVEPSDAQVFVDGYFFGMPEDFDGRHGQLALEAGTHRLQLIAPGYESVTLEAKIGAAETVTYRNAMTPAAVVAPAVPAAPIEHRTIYLIPGCYLGNVSPKDAGLPASCDVSRVRTFQP